MFSIFTTLWSSLWTTIALAGVGAVTGLLAYWAGRLTTWWIPAIVGAVLVVGAYGSGSMSRLISDNAKAQISQLEAEKAKLQHDYDALAAVHEFEQEQAAEEAEKAKETEKKYQEVLAIIAKHKDDDSCLSAEELKAIGEMK
jgi:outer membrane murein-binding lipoprotein Lpp